MKYIEKQPEPSQFIVWKNQESSRLDSLTTASDRWEVFPSSCPDIAQQDPSITYYSKFELKESLLNEQGFICCYCNQQIKNDHNTVIEHLKDKSTHIDLTFEYSNLLACCNGGQKEPKPREIYCDAKKRGDALLISPQDRSCEVEFYFSVNGKIHFVSKNAEEAIRVLNLGTEVLNRLRKEAIEGIIYDENGDLITEEEAETIYDKIYKRDTDNQFIPFCSAIKSVLERDLFNPQQD